jgi:XTP/dITP diphosphohydrolase
MNKLIVASNNDHKIKEIKEILKELPIEVKSLKEEGIDIDVIEDGNTFIENSYKKASEIAQYLKKNNKEKFIVMADDSGLVVDYLNGEPGVFSARYAGEHGDSVKNNKKLLENLKGVVFEDRKANFVCAVVLMTSEGKDIKVLGKCSGYIIEDPKGFDGFGYDPLFYVPEFKKTFAQMSGEEKNKISHRGKALEKIKEELKDIL